MLYRSMNTPWVLARPIDSFGLFWFLQVSEPSVVYYGIFENYYLFVCLTVPQNSSFVSCNRMSPHALF